MHGLHLTADLHRCAADPSLMTDADALRRQCLAAVRDAGLRAVGELFHSFTPASGPNGAPHEDGACGVTGVVLLAESHVALHTWPELAAVTLDVYVCNRGADNSERAQALLAALESLFEPAEVERHAVRRGALDARPSTEAPS